MHCRVSASLLLCAAALAGCGTDEVSSPTSPEAGPSNDLPVLTTAHIAKGPSFSFSLPEAAQRFHITLRFVNTPTANQAAAFEVAAARWEGLIHGDLAAVTGIFPANACGAGFPMPAYDANATPIDDLLINVLLQPIDGVGNVLGAAGACFIRTAGGLPVFGLMFFDTADIANLETTGLLDEVIVHEMGHVLGFSSGFFNRAGLLANVFAGTTDPRFLGKTALGKYRALGGTALTIPLEGFAPPPGRCGSGTALSHWNEGTFHNELMTGFINGASANFINPMSPMTAGALADIGYVIAPQGEAYTLTASPADPCPPPVPGGAVDGLHIAAHEIILDAVGRVN